MKRLLGLSAILAMAAAHPALCATVAGVQVDDTVKLGSVTLVLNGAGKRTRLIFDVYVAALYLPFRQSAAAQVLRDTGPKRMSLTLMRQLSASQLTDAFREGIALNSGRAETDAMRAQIDSLVATMAAIGSAAKGDLLTIDFLADGSTRVALNGAPKGMPIPGVDFQRALLKVWLGEKPVQADLKSQLLGG
jgi:hypothetical protein